MIATLDECKELDLEKMDDDRLKKQLKFIEEVEKLKRIKRQNKTLDNGRSENSAEHSWHVALMAIILYEHANDQ